MALTCGFTRSTADFMSVLRDILDAAKGEHRT